MRSNNLAISVMPPKDGPICDKNCNYCVSRMTGYPVADDHLIMRNLDKVKMLATMAGVSSVMFTGKGEPTLNYGGLVTMMTPFKKWPGLELQTNGYWLNKSENLDAVSELHRIGLDIVAVSVDSEADCKNLQPLFEKVRSSDMKLRICYNLVKFEPILNYVEDLIEMVIKCGADQLLVRKITIPKYIDEGSIAAINTRNWIINNVSFELYDVLEQQFISRYGGPQSLVRILPHGATVYDYKGKISVSFSNYCIQEANNTDDIRSLIFMEDGHVYTSWDKVSSFLF
jgi:hypothetical protein